MAKGENMLGKFRGKVGATVFRIEAGVGQISSEYNAHPKNPRTIAQTKQRTKMNLAGLFSKMTPYAALAGMGDSRRKARSEFVSNIVKHASVTGSGTATSPFVASIEPSGLVFSKGGSGNCTIARALYEGSHVIGTPLVANGNRNVTALMMVVVVSKGSLVKEIAVGSTNVPETGVTSPVDVTLSTGTPTAEDNVDCYAFPVLKSDGAASIMSDLDIDWANDQYSVSVARSLASINAFGASYYVGKATQGE